MRVLGACSIGGSGHLQPLLAFLDAARHAGHETLLIAPGPLAEQVVKSGHPYAPGGEPPDEELSRIRDGLAHAPPEEAAVLGNRELFGRLAATAMLPAMELVIGDWRPSLVLRDPCEYASAVVAPSKGVPTAQVAIDLAAAEWRSIDIAAPALVAHRSSLVQEVRASAYLTRFPVSLDPSPFQDTRRFSVRTVSSPRPLPDWWSGSRSPLIYMTLGSVLGHLPVADAAFEALIAAVAEMTDARVLLTVGVHFDRARLGALPPHVHVEGWVDQTRVLPHVELVVCHGGSGTTFGALAAGRPLVVLPLFVGGQFSNAERVESAGAGVKVPLGSHGERRPLARSDGPRIRDAIERVRADTSYASRAKSIGAEMSEAPGPSEVLASLLE